MNITLADFLIGVWPLVHSQSLVFVSQRRELLLVKGLLFTRMCGRCSEPERFWSLQSHDVWAVTRGSQVLHADLAAADAGEELAGLQGL